MITFFYNRTVKFLCSGFILVALVLLSYGPMTPTSVVREAEAQAAVAVVGGNGTFQETISAIYNTMTGIASVASRAYNGITSFASNSLYMKEYILDGIAYSLINIAIQQLTRSIVEWINSGFEGSPSFVTDLDGFLLDVADIQAGKFLTELGLGAMCAPFRLDVQLALALQYQKARKYEAQCRLSEVVQNVDGFLNGDFSQGGWDGWFTLTTQPGNNQHDALLEAQWNLGLAITNARGEQLKLLDFGRGFLTYEVCDEDGTADDCYYTTPGAVIEDQLNNNLDSGRNRLIMADEINEILGALMSQLVSQTFAGAGGLLGLTTSGYQSNGFSYVQAVTDTPPQNTSGLTVDSANAIAVAIDVEDRYIALQERIVSLVDGAEAYLASSCAAGELSLPTSLRNARSNALIEIAIAEDNLAILIDLNTRYLNSTDPNEKYDIYQTLLALQASGDLHSETDIATLDIVETRPIREDVNEFQDDINDFCDNQNSGNNNNNGGGGGGNQGD